MIKDAGAVITRKDRWKDYLLLSLRSPGIARTAQPGQFVMVRVSDQPHPLLRRPFSIHFRDGDWIEVFFKICGTGTNLLARKEEGQSLDILGPLGNGFSLEGDFMPRQAWIVGGGRGIAPLYFLAEELRSRGCRVKIFYGGRSIDDLPLREKFARRGLDVLCSTDDGSFGFKGFVSELLSVELEKTRPDRIYACGPDAMMKEIAGIAASRKIQAEFSLESIMGCGFGACWGCVKKIKKQDKEGWHKVCEEGPVFPGAEIVWEEDDG